MKFEENSCIYKRKIYKFLSENQFSTIIGQISHTHTDKGEILWKFLDCIVSQIKDVMNAYRINM